MSSGCMYQPRAADAVSTSHSTGPGVRPYRPSQARYTGTHMPPTRRSKSPAAMRARLAGDHQRAPPATAVRHAPPGPRPTPRPARANARGTNRQQTASPNLYVRGDGPPIR